MADTAPIDLHFPGTYHGVKRTMLLFCAALVVLAVSHTKSDSGVSILGTTLSVETGYLRLLLWLGATIFMGGYLVEFDMARLLNSEALRNTNAASVNAVLEDIVKRLKKLHEDIYPSFQEFKARQEQHLQTFQTLASNLPRPLKKPPDPMDIDRQIFLGEADRILRDMVKAAANNLEQRKEVTNATADAAEKIREMRADFDGLAKRIDRGRQLSFYWLELGGTILAYGAASATCVPALVEWLRAVHCL